MAALDTYIILITNDLNTDLHISFNDWIKAFFRRKKFKYNNYLTYKDSIVIPLFRGRTCVNYSLALLKILRNDGILFPAYHCGCELNAVLHSGINVYYYDVNTNLIPIIDLTCPPPKSVKAIYIIHPFGFLTQIESIRIWCDYYNIFLIEDCATVFPCGVNKMYGHVSIFSPRKFLGTLHGGILRINDVSIISKLPAFKECHNNFLIKEFLNQINFLHLKSYYNEFRVLIFKLFVKKNKQDSTYNHNLPISYEFCLEKDENRASHAWFSALMASVSWSDIAKKRILNYRLLYERLQSIDNIKPLMGPLEDDIVPLNFPVVVEHRSKVACRMNSSGVDAVQWWSGFHKNVNEWQNYPGAVTLKNSVLVLPIHQGISSVEINKIADALIRATLP